MESSLLARAIEIAQKAHQGQIDATGKPNVEHVMRVMSAGKGESEMVVGALHDLIEDTPWTMEQLREEHFPEEVLAAVEALTRQPEEEYASYIRRVAQNPLALQVKLYDLTDNMDVRRLNRIGEREVARLSRYLKAYRYLTDQLGEALMAAGEEER